MGEGGKGGLRVVFKGGMRVGEREGIDKTTEYISIFCDPNFQPV